MIEKFERADFAIANPLSTPSGSRAKRGSREDFLATGPHILIHVDGVASGSPACGVWSADLRRMDGPVELRGPKRLSGAEVSTSTQRMEVTAAIEALAFLKPGEPQGIFLVSSSPYLIDGATRFLSQWRSAGWRNNSGKVIANVDLWRALDTLLIDRQVTWVDARSSTSDTRLEAVRKRTRQALKSGSGFQH